MKHTNTSVVTRKGQITIPADIRKALNIEEGDRMIFQRQIGSIQLLTVAEFVRRTAGSLAPEEEVPPATIAQLNEAAAQGWIDDAIEDLLS